MSFNISNHANNIKFNSLVFPYIFFLQFLKLCGGIHYIWVHIIAKVRESRNEIHDIFSLTFIFQPISSASRWRLNTDHMSLGSTVPVLPSPTSHHTRFLVRMQKGWREPGRMLDRIVASADDCFGYFYASRLYFIHKFE